MFNRQPEHTSSKLEYRLDACGKPRPLCPVPLLALHGVAKRTYLLLFDRVLISEVNFTLP